MVNNLVIKGSQNFLGKEIKVIEGGFGPGQKVMLAKTIAEIHEVELRKINELINNNIDEFEIGIDLIDLKNDNEFAILAKDNGLFTTNSLNASKNIYLLSEQGYFALVQLMRTEKAKEIRKQLRREYFKMRETIKEQYTFDEKSENIRLEFTAFECTANLLNLNEVSKLAGAEKIYDDHGISKAALPKYVKSKGVTKSATELLKKFNAGISATKFNKIMIEKGYLKELERRSTKDPDKPKKFKNLVNDKYGENQVNPNNPKETQPMYYEEKFEELLKELGIK